MTGQLRLVLFDVDGTLVDSQASIVAAMTAAFAGSGLPVPERSAILSIVGLSLPHAMERLAPGHTARDALVTAYKDAYFAQRAEKGAARLSPLYPGARRALERLSSRPEILLGVATGKSRRGLDAVLADHGLEALFVTRQTADHHPSKPHPSMIETAMAEAGVGPEATVMVGDTSFDIEMARAAGARSVGVGWGYHAPEALQRADKVVHGFNDLAAALEEIWSRPA